MIYSAAGLCPSDLGEDDDPTPPIATRSRPDHPASHVPPTSSENDPLCGVKIPCFEDQLKEFGLLIPKIYWLVVILPVKDLTIYIHFALLTGTLREVI